MTAIAFITEFLLLPLVSPGHAAQATVLSVPAAPARMLAFAVVWCVLAGYCVSLWTRGRRTLPQKTWGLRLVDAGGHPPGTPRALARYAALWIGPALALVAWLALHPLGLQSWSAWLLPFNFAWALVDPDRAFLHDRLAGTRVLRG